jgi:hypothetical protein
MTTPTSPQRPTDYDLALRVLQQQGLNVEDARKVLSVDPQTVNRLAPVGLEQWADEATAAAQAAWEASDEGKRAAAQQLIARDADIDARRKEAQAILRAKGAPDVELTDAELSKYSGIEIPTTEEARPPSMNSMIREARPSDAEMQENLAAIERVSKESAA